MSVAKKKISKQLPRHLFGSVVDFMALAGFSHHEIRKAFEKAFSEARDKLTSATADRASEKQTSGDVSALLLRIWHRDSAYIDNKDYKPRSLPLLAGKNSLRSIVKKLDPDADPEDVLNSMRATGLIRKTANGRYLPTRSAVVLAAPHPWAVEHAAQSVLRLLSTVERNANGGANGLPLLERYSYVPNLDPMHAQPFAEFARRQGQVLLDTLDDWLEQRCTKRRSNAKKANAGVPAGIHLITFLGDGAIAPVSADGQATKRDAKRRLNPPKRRAG